MNSGKIMSTNELGIKGEGNLKKPRYVPILRDVRNRTMIGLCLLLISILIAQTTLGSSILMSMVIGVVLVLVWLLSVYLTDKYVHKYPQRYFTYLIVSHFKAFVIMSLLLIIVGLTSKAIALSSDVLFLAFIIFTFTDFLVSIPFCRESIETVLSRRDSPSNSTGSSQNELDRNELDDLIQKLVNTRVIVKKVQSELDMDTFKFIKDNIPTAEGDCDKVLVLEDIVENDSRLQSNSIGLLVGSVRMNDVRRLNRFLMFCANHITTGGYISIRYTPYENVVRTLKRRYSSPLYWLVFMLHFIWYRAVPKIPFLDTIYFSSAIPWLDSFYLAVTKRRNRVLPKAEMWGRLAFCGLEVIAESQGDDELVILAQKVSAPVQNRRPSYHMIVALEKVGLDGETMRTHKIRSMYPFSEFLQKRLYEDHGLSSTGKFQGDFRLTDYGKVIRKYWLDELPQIFDWLRGDIKLVGMRATSPQFLSLYPKELYELYIQIKPGLIPPIFDESTDGFEQIVDVELEYLRRYWQKPIQTDILYFYKTFVDIFFRGIRSK